MNTQLTLGATQDWRTRVAKNPVLLLVASGILIGLNFPLAKLAGQHQIPAAFWVMLNSLGASAAMFFILIAQRKLKWPNAREWRFAAIAGPFTFAGPGILVYQVVPNVGAGISGVLFALSPVCTLLLASLLGLNQLNRRKVLGIFLGMSGAMGMSLLQGVNQNAAMFWYFIAAAIPIALAIGNVYRSLDWPENSSPELLAFWSHTLAFLVYGAYTFYKHAEIFLPNQFNGDSLLIAQVLIGAATAPLIFRLQRFGGPVMLSQIGYVAAATSLVLASAFLGESYTWLSWMCGVCVLIGVLISVWRGRSQDRR